MIVFVHTPSFISFYLLVIEKFIKNSGALIFKNFTYHCTSFYALTSLIITQLLIFRDWILHWFYFYTFLKPLKPLKQNFVLQCPLRKSCYFIDFIIKGIKAKQAKET